MSFLSWLLPSGRVSFHHAPNPILLTRRTVKPEDDGSPQHISLGDLCRSATPSKCKLNPFLFNGHLQTAWTAVKTDDVPVHYKRRAFEADDPDYAGHFEVDFVVQPYEAGNVMDSPSKGKDSVAASSLSADASGLPPRTSFFTDAEFASLPSDDTKPMLIVLHGLSGGSHEMYLRHAIAPLAAQGWESCVVNFRGCAKSKVTSSILYNARATWDVRQLVRWLRHAFPKRPLFGIGFSLGANILTNYLGEEGDKCNLKAAVICSNPWNLEVSSIALQRTWVGLEIYSKTMGSNMKRVFEEHVHEVSKHPRVNVERVRNTKYLHEFDRELQGPVWGYPTENAYYRDASSVDSIFAIRIPFFVIQAEDDPISVKEALPYNEIKKAPYGVMCTTSWGGHLSWFEYGGGRWFTKPITSFFVKMATEIDLDTKPIIAPVSAPISTPPHIPERPSSTQTGKADGPMPDYDPMRRKLQLPIVP